MNWEIYGVCRDGLVYRMKVGQVGVTGILRWRFLFSREDRKRLFLNMYDSGMGMVAQMTAPSKNQMKRMRKRGQA